MTVSRFGAVRVPGEARSDGIVPARFRDRDSTRSVHQVAHLPAITTLVAAILLSWALPSPVFGGLLTNFEKNAVVMIEASALSTSMVITEYGPSQAALSFSGQFSDVAWSLGLTGTYLGNPLALTFTGTFDTTLGQGTFTSAGSIGTDSWTGSGSWSYLDLSPNTDGLLWAANATILGKGGLVKGKPDTEVIVPKDELTTDNGKTRHTVSQGMYFDTKGGTRVGRIHDQTDDSIGPSGGSGTAVCSLTIPDHSIFLTGSYDQGGGAISGIVQVVPEPCSLLLLASGLALVGVWGRRWVNE